MPTPTVSIGFSPTIPAPDAGYQNAKPRGDGGTTLLRESFEVPNTGIASVKTANYTAIAADCGKLLSFADSSPATAHTLTLPATPPFAQWQISVQNTGTGTLTIDRNGKTIDGAATNLTLGQGSGMVIFTDGTNYFTERGRGRGIVEVPLAPSSDGNFTVAHGLGVTPSSAVIQMTSDGAIWFQTPTRYDATNLYLVASSVGITGNAVVFS